jgi:hypothetical protein
VRQRFDMPLQRTSGVSKHNIPYCDCEEELCTNRKT